MLDEGKKRKNACFGRVKGEPDEAICFVVYNLHVI